MSERRATLTRESVLEGVSKGDRNFTQLARRHGHVGNVSSTFTANVRRLVPDVADRFAGKVTTVVAVEAPQVTPPVEAPVQPVTAEQPAVSVPQRKTPYRGMYGAVFARAVKAGEIPVQEFIVTAATDIMADPACAKDVARLQARAGDRDMVGQVRQAINFAIQVLRAPNHRSNLGRSMNTSEKRGTMRIVPVGP
jgi:hypothetical protein